MTITESRAAGRVAPTGDIESSKDVHPIEDLIAYLKRYSREKPQLAALGCLVVGFVLGWKLKPW